MGDFGADVKPFFIVSYCMDSIFKNKQREFIAEEVQKAIDDSIRQVYGFKEEPNSVTVTYSKEKVNLWASQIIDYTIRGLNKLEKPFKYCVTAILQQNNGAGMTVCVFKET